MNELAIEVLNDRIKALKYVIKYAQEDFDDGFVNDFTYTQEDVDAEIKSIEGKIENLKKAIEVLK